MKYTIIATCRPFVKEPFVTNQTNALESWARLGCEVILLGRDVGMAEIAARFGFRHILGVEYKWGVPLVSSLFGVGEKHATNEIVVYVNADIILTPELTPAIEMVSSRFDQFLMGSKRYDLNKSPGCIDFSGNWQNPLRKMGKWTRPDTSDFHVFRKGFAKRICMKPFLAESKRWDTWMMDVVLVEKMPLIDSTKFVWSYHPKHAGRKLDKKKIRWNEKLAKDRGRTMLWHAGWYLTESGKLVRKRYRIQSTVKRPYELAEGCPRRKDPCWPIDHECWDIYRKVGRM